MDSKNKEHSIYIENRQRVDISGVDQVDNYNDKQIFLQTSKGNLLLKGEGLNIKGLNIEEGNLEITGKIESVGYTEAQSFSGKKLLRRLFK